MVFDQLSVGNEPLENFARIIQAWDGARGLAARRQTNVVIPNRDGELWLPKAREAKVFTVGMSILGCDPTNGVFPATRIEERARFNQNWQDFIRLIANDTGPLTLGRTMVYPGGRIERQTARAEIDGSVDPEMIDMSSCRVAVSFKLLDGLWFGDWSDTLNKIQSDVSGDFASAVTTMALESPGDSTTWQVEVIMSGGTNQRLTNNSTGDWVQFNGNTTTPVTLDVPTFTATQGGANVISKITSGDTRVSPYWMTLRPGPNELTVTGGGTIQVRYKGAHG